MPAGLMALRNNCVASVILKPAGLVHGSRRGNDLRPCPPNACQQVLVRKTELEADNLGMELHDEIAHFFVEGSAVGAQSGSIVIEAQLDVVGIQTSSPGHFASRVVARLRVTEEVHIDWARCLPADDFEFPARLLDAQEGTRERAQSSSLRNSDHHVRKNRSRHRCLNNWKLNIKEIENAIIGPHVHSLRELTISSAAESRFNGTDAGVKGTPGLPA